MLLPQLGKLPGRGSLGSHSPGRKPLWEDSGGAGLGPKLFSKESISRSCCPQPLPQPRSLPGVPGCLHAALTPWTHSAPPWQGTGFEGTEPLCLSSPSWEAPGLSRREQSLLVSEQKGQGSCAGVRAGALPSPPEQLPSCQPVALVPTPHPWGAPSCLLLLPVFLQIPSLRETNSANANPSLPSLLVSGCCLQSHWRKHSHPFRKPRHFQPFHRDTS